MAEDVAPSLGKIRVKIVCPTKVMADAEVDSVEIPTSLGIRLIIPKQAPLFCLIKLGKVILNQGGKAEKIYIVSDGICEVRRDICAILAWGVEVSEIEKEEVEAKLKEADEALQNIEFPQAREEVQNRIAYYREILKYIGMNP